MNSRLILIQILFVPILLGASCVQTTRNEPQRFKEDIAALSIEALKSRSDIPSIASSSDITIADEWEYGDSIDEPVFVSMNRARGKLREDGLGILIEIGKTRRYYPFQLMQGHAVVNDTLADEHIMITYCPRCRTGIAFLRAVRGDILTFGVSGKLYQNNLLMYNKDGGPQSLWSQAWGKAILGAFAGTELAILPSEHIKWGDLLEQYQDGDVDVMANNLDTKKPLSQEDGDNLCSSTK